jgi:hypothetical protein
MNQCERTDLINRTNYWGISRRRCISVILKNISTWKNIPNTGWFLWECPSRSFNRPTDVRFALAVTQMYSVYGDQRYVKKIISSRSGKNKGLEIASYTIDNAEAYTVYILKSETDGRYYELGDRKSMHRCRIPYDDEKYKQMFSSSTLDEAIERATARFQDFARMLYFPSPAAYCPPISRFISFNDSEKSCVNRVWTLQKLCLFFVQSYWKIDTIYNGPHLPKKIKYLLLRMCAVNECSENLRLH